MAGTLFRRVCRPVILRGGFFANSIKWTFSVDSPVENAIFVALNVTLYMRIPSSLAAFAVCILMAFSHAFPMRAGERALQTPSQPADSALRRTAPMPKPLQCATRSFGGPKPRAT